MTNSSAEYLRSNELVSRDDSRLLIVDMQEKLLPHIPVRELLIRNCRRLIEAADILGVPHFATVQYPKGLGYTTPELAELLGEIPEKQRFTCAEVLAWGGAAEQADGRDKVVMAGMEAHVCVQQTALDLMAQGYQVYVPADAVASRHKFDWSFALKRLADSGATITTTEALLFEWCEVSGTPEFKEISRLVKEG